MYQPDLTAVFMKSILNSYHVRWARIVSAAVISKGAVSILTNACVSLDTCGLVLVSGALSMCKDEEG